MTQVVSYMLAGLLILIVILIMTIMAFNSFFKYCEHPEKYAIFLRNIEKEDMDNYGGLSIWRAKTWWPTYLIHYKYWKN